MLRATLVAILFAITGFPQAGKSQDGNLIREEKPIPEFGIVGRMDRNDDRFLETTEIPETARNFVDALITSWDAEKEVIRNDGRIDLNRLKSQLQGKIEKKSTTVEATRAISNRECILYAAQLVSLYDRDGDQSLDANEFEKLASKWVECDLNQDFRLEIVEVAYGLKYALNFPRTSDGKIDISQEEFVTKALNEAYVDWRREQARRQSKQTSGESAPTDRSREYAQALISNYDRDRDGCLNPTELGLIGESWLEVDFDQNGKASVNEIQVRFQDYAARAGTDIRKPQGPIDPVEASLTPADTQPANPPWDAFEKLDADRGGQIEMHEFAEKFDASVVADFYTRDADRDGVITRNEWNRFLAKQNQGNDEDVRPVNH